MGSKHMKQITKLIKIIGCLCIISIIFVFCISYFYKNENITVSFERHLFETYKLFYRNNTLRLFGRYVSKEIPRTKGQPQNVLLEITNVRNLIIELLQRQRENAVNKNVTVSAPSKAADVSVYNFNASLLYKRKNNSVYNSPNYDGDLVYPDISYFLNERTVKDVSCLKLFQNDSSEMSKAVKLMQKPMKAKLPEAFIKETRNCSTYIHKTAFINSSLTKDEESFPIAYSILMYTDVEQFEKLLRAVYRPQNFYCIHVDNSSADDIYLAVSGIASCFENIIMASKRFKVAWGKYTIITPEFACMEQLLRFKKWKYFINLTGQEFPLRTNSELVRILAAYNGANDVEGTVERADPSRWSGAGEPPDGIRPVKGAVHIAVNRDFVDYVINSPIAERLRKWVSQVDFPDEVYFSSLNHNPQLGIPGSYKGVPETNHIEKPFLTRFKNWGIPPNEWPCAGERVRLLCVFGVRDLPLLASRPELFANKFHIYFEPYALQCLEELHFNRTRDEYLTLLEYDISFYEHLQFIKNVVK